MNYCEFVLRTQLKVNTTYIRRNGQGYRLYKGVEIPEEDFKQATALPQRPFISQDNPCKKHLYLNVEGCAISNLEKLIACK